MKPAAITRTLHSRGVMFAMIFAVTALAVAAFVLGAPVATFETNGFVTACSGTFVLPAYVSLALGVTLMLGVSVLLNYLNRTYNLLRARTSLQSSVFLLMMLSTPAIAVYANSGLVMCVVILWCTMVLYAQFGRVRYDKRNALLVFFLLSACSAFDFRYALYVPVFAVGFGQMRIFTLRTIIAMIVGIVTPWVIALGMGLVSPDQLMLPDVPLVMTKVTGPAESLFVGVAVYTALLTAGCLLQCVIKIMSYTARARAQQGFITLLTIVTLIFAVASSAGLAQWMPLVNCCAALQFAHLFCSIHVYPKSYIAIVSILSVYVLALGAQIAIAVL